MSNLNKEVMDHFSKEVCDELKYYVYRLIDPRNGETFYVGKGKDNRVFAHVKGALKNYDGENYEKEDDDVDVNPTKIERIREIEREKLEVIHIIQRWGMEEEAAFEVEAALIDCYPGLTNEVNGHGHNRGVCNAGTLERTLARETYDEPKDFEYIIIKIRQDVIDLRPEKEPNEIKIYETVRSAWKVDFKKVNDTKKYPYVFAVVNGIVEGVYRVEKWEKHPEMSDRSLFIGEKAEDKIWKEFVNKRIPATYIKKGLASPVLYSKNIENKR